MKGLSICLTPSGSFGRARVVSELPQLYREPTVDSNPISWDLRSYSKPGPITFGKPWNILAFLIRVNDCLKGASSRSEKVHQNFQTP